MNVRDAIRARYSVRSYRKQPIAEDAQAALNVRLRALQAGPLGSPTRFGLVAATERDRASLRGLGTYGFIKDPTGFILGAVKAGEHALEDYGYTMEQAILAATDLGLGTCWLGGSFTQSSFGRQIGKRRGEIVPAVTATGYAVDDSRAGDPTRRLVRADRRLPWEALFFDGRFGQPLAREAAGRFAEALEMVRIAPSASNKQPWRIVKDGPRWHFYCQRTPGYGKGSWYFVLLRLADLQRLDVGIAMCHFELAANELGLRGTWTASDPGLPPADKKTLYVATWTPGSQTSPDV
jgi:nitroreductase